MDTIAYRNFCKDVRSLQGFWDTDGVRFCYAHNEFIAVHMQGMPDAAYITYDGKEYTYQMSKVFEKFADINALRAYMFKAYARYAAHEVAEQHKELSDTECNALCLWLIDRYYNICVSNGFAAMRQQVAQDLNRN